LTYFVDKKMQFDIK